METVARSSDIACLLRDANVAPGNVSSLLKELDWDQIFSKGESADDITTQLRVLFPGEQPSTLALFSALIMKGYIMADVPLVLTRKQRWKNCDPAAMNALLRTTVDSQPTSTSMFQMFSVVHVR